MFRTVKNALILMLLWGVDLPESPYLRNLIAQVSDELGLLAYPEGEKWSQTKELWRRVKQNDGRPLSEMLAFPNGLSGEWNLYLSILHGIIGPEKWRLRMQMENSVGYFKDVAKARLERISWHYRIYDLMDDLTRETVPLWQKRIKLSELRELLGDRYYFNGCLPPALP